MSEFDTTDEVEPEERPDEEEYVGEGDGPTSRETGTRYDEQGEAETTPQDLVEDDDEDEE
ncbi:hypothetical protein [Nocardioides sp. YIM 152315]|uniref:hypothetical protein n=1 Tax=Nocardioides sp. YIM 152315 TaxID=3031760 RepID=UPI0023DAE2C1|nr:hypothetical protein [Nocardioides sp. YIM 152315]MDF1605715.1 hypothetical protein [Nocardioides sp. YIM 152315]